MSEAKRYTVLGFGEKYMVEAERRGRPPGEPPKGRSLVDARKLLTPKVDEVVQTARSLRPSQRISEVVVELRLDEKFLAKSYAPTDLLKETNLNLRGAGTWVQQAIPRGKQKKDPAGAPVAKKSKSLFVSGSMDAINRLALAVKQGLSEDADNDIVKLEDVRVPEANDRLHLSSVDVGDEHAVEVVLFNWPERLRKQAIDRVLELFQRHQIAPQKYRVKEYSNGPSFVAGVLPAAAISELGEYNFLRSARSLPRVSLTKAIMRRSVPLGTAPLATPPPVATIAVFDGGYAPHPLLDRYVASVDLTPKPAVPDAVEHGTMVASAAVYGPFDLSGAIPAPQCLVKSYRVFPDPADDDLELYGAIDAIEAHVPQLGPEVRVINLSFGPEGPIDDVPSRFTYALDRLAREHAKLFVTAVGNDGEHPGADRVQAPSDSINNLGVGAYRHSSSGAPEHARYSCKGPGRSGGTKKPDLVAFGGCVARPFFALVPGVGTLGNPSGTSFATPLVSALAGRLGALVTNPANLQPEAIRSLLIHSASGVDGAAPLLVGHGRIPTTVEDVIACSEKRVSVLYQGTVSPRESWKLPFLLPPGFEPGGSLAFEWTIAYAPEVDLSSPDEYALAGLDVAFRPHSDVYRYSPPAGQSGSPLVLNIVADAAKCQKLEANGWKRGALPVSDTRKGKNEATLRAADGKWETVLRSSRAKRSTSVSEPLLTVAVQGRGDWDQKDPSLRARFAAVLTVDAPKYNGDLYTEVREAWDMLQPLRLRGQPMPHERIRT
ncbi:S8 family peptidase [Sorangium sp. So ce429]